MLALLCPWPKPGDEMLVLKEPAPDRLRGNPTLPEDEPAVDIPAVVPTGGSAAVRFPKGRPVMFSRGPGICASAGEAL